MWPFCVNFNLMRTFSMEHVVFIHLNPVRAGVVSDLASLDSYPCSGHAVILRNLEMAGQMVDEALACFGNCTRTAGVKYRQFIAEGVALWKRAEFGSARRITKGAIEEFGDEAYDARVLGSGDFIRYLRQRRELETHMPCAVELGTIVARVCEHYGIAADTLRENKRSATIAVARSVICYLAVRRGGYSGVEVGKHVNLQRAGVSVAAGRGEKLAQTEPVLLRLIDNKQRL